MQLPLWLSSNLRAFERSPVGDLVRNVPNLYPLLESFHIVGIALLVGAAIAVDLRLIGVGREALPVTTTLRYLLPISHAGFGLAAVTGLVMFSGVAVSVAGSTGAPWKLALLVLAAINIAVFHQIVYRDIDRWDRAATPLRAKACALVSVTVWIGVIIAGRFLAY